MRVLDQFDSDTCCPIHPTGEYEKNRMARYTKDASEGA